MVWGNENQFAKEILNRDHFKYKTLVQMSPQSVMEMEFATKTELLELKKRRLLLVFTSDKRDKKIIACYSPRISIQVIGLLFFSISFNFGVK